MTFIFPRRWLSGLTLSTAGGSPTMGITAGQAADSTNSIISNFPAAMTKTTASWALGSGVGGFLDVGSVAINTWYHVFLIDRPDTLVPDIGFSASLTPTLPTGYTVSRRIGSMLTDGSSNWTQLSQWGDHFTWALGITDINFPGTLGTISSNFPLSVPPGIKVIAKFRCDFTNSSVVSGQLLLSSLDETPFAAGASWPAGMTTMQVQVAGVGNYVGEHHILTDTSQNIRVQSAGSSLTLLLNTYGWIDRRGQDD